MSKIQHDQSEINAIFIHSAIDDAGLSVHEFRLVCHLARRAGNGEAFPSAESMARVCKMKRDTVFKVLKSLKGRNIVTVKQRDGDSNLYRINKPSVWKNSPPATRPPKRGSPEWGDAPSKGMGVVPNRGMGVVPNGGTVSISTEVYPSKGIHSIGAEGQQKQETFPLGDEHKEPPPTPPQPKPTDPRLQTLYRAYKPRSTVGPTDKERKSWKMVEAEFDPSDREIKELCEFVQEFRKSGRNGKAAFCHRDLYTALNNFGKFLACASDFHHHQKNRGEPDYSQVEDGGKW